MPRVTAAPRRGAAVVLTLLMAVLLAACGPSTSGTATYGPGTAASVSGAASLAPATPTSDLRTVDVAQLPAEAVATLRLIAVGGPFPYSRDGVTFQNREGVLPREKTGYYREYTVTTPGESDRGARRIVAAQDGARFYTDDHYASFREVVSGATS